MPESEFGTPNRSDISELLLEIKLKRIKYFFAEIKKGNNYHFVPVYHIYKWYDVSIVRKFIYDNLILDSTEKMIKEFKRLGGNDIVTTYDFMVILNSY